MAYSISKTVYNNKRIIMKKIVLLFFVVFSLSLYAQEVGIRFSNDSLLSEALARSKKEGKLVFIDCYTTWCGPCKLLAPHLQAIQNKYKGKLIVYKIDVDKSPELAQKFNVDAMPTIVFMNNKSFNSELGYREFNDLENLVKTYFFRK